MLPQIVGCFICYIVDFIQQNLIVFLLNFCELVSTLIIIQLITLKLSNKDVYLFLFTSKFTPNFLAPIHKRDKMK